MHIQKNQNCSYQAQFCNNSMVQFEQHFQKEFFTLTNNRCYYKLHCRNVSIISEFLYHIYINCLSEELIRRTVDKFHTAYFFNDTRMVQKMHTSSEYNVAVNKKTTKFINSSSIPEIGTIPFCIYRCPKNILPNY